MESVSNDTVINDGMELRSGRQLCNINTLSIIKHTFIKRIKKFINKIEFENHLIKRTKYITNMYAYILENIDDFKKSCYDCILSYDKFVEMILQKVPLLLEECIYILKNITKKYNKKTMDEISVFVNCMDIMWKVNSHLVRIW
jgi:hypothetical protein